jgi:hypothetical protein
MAKSHVTSKEVRESAERYAGAAHENLEAMQKKAGEIPDGAEFEDYVATVKEIHGLLERQMQAAQLLYLGIGGLLAEHQRETAGGNGHG